MKITAWGHEAGRIILGVDFARAEKWAAISFFKWTVSVTWE
jgi:hypothetical protein